MTEENRFTINTVKVVYDTLDGEVIIINFETGNYYSLNSTGKDIWSYLEVNMNLNEMVDGIIDKYEGNFKVVKEDITQLLDNLLKEELIKINNAESGYESNDKKNITDILNAEKLKYEKPGFLKYTDMKDMLLLDPIHDVDETGWPAAKVPATKKE